MQLPSLFEPFKSKLKEQEFSFFQSNIHLPWKKCRLTINERDLFRFFLERFESQRKSWLKMEKVSTFFGLLGLIRKKSFLFEHYLRRNDCGLKVGWNKLSQHLKRKHEKWKWSFFKTEAVFIALPVCQNPSVGQKPIKFHGYLSYK